MGSLKSFVQEVSRSAVVLLGVLNCYETEFGLFLSPPCLWPLFTALLIFFILFEGQRGGSFLLSLCFGAVVPNSWCDCPIGRMHCSHRPSQRSHRWETHLSISMGLRGELWGVRQLGARLSLSLLLDRHACQGCAVHQQSHREETEEGGVQGHSQLYFEFKVSLASMRSCFKTQTQDWVTSEQKQHIFWRSENRAPSSLGCVGTACCVDGAFLSCIHTEEGEEGAEGATRPWGVEPIQECRERPWRNYLQPHLFKPFPWDSVRTHEFWRDPSEFFFL